MVTTICKDYLTKVPEYVNFLYGIKKLIVTVMVGILSVNFLDIKNQMPLKLVRVVASREDDSGLWESWSIGQ